MSDMARPSGMNEQGYPQPTGPGEAAQSGSGGGAQIRDLLATAANGGPADGNDPVNTVPF